LEFQFPTKEKSNTASNMKLNSLTVISALSLGLVATASAQNRVYITGSTAFRPATYDALVSIFDSAPSIAAYKASTVGALDPHTAGQMLFDGNISGARYVIKCAWSGSEAGILDIATAGKTENFIDDINVNGVQAITSTSTASATDAHSVDLALADNSQAASKTKSPSLTGTKVGIIPFIWVKNAQTGGPADWGRLVNVTHPQLRVALSGGTKLALITGNTADTKYVYVAGRDNNSGTRVNSLADTGYGIRTLVRQTIIGGSLGAPTLGTPLGNGGQSSGGTLANTMTFTGSATATDTVNGGTGWYAIAYLGMYDADVAIGGGAVGLTLNGVAESTGAIQEGQYSFWGQEWLYQNPTLSTAASTVNGKLLTAIPLHVDGTHSISLTSMNASKASDTADPTHN
jgi:hypothetical protein